MNALTEYLNGGGGRWLKFAYSISGIRPDIVMALSHARILYRYILALSVSIAGVAQQSRPLEVSPAKPDKRKRWSQIRAVILESKRTAEALRLATQLSAEKKRRRPIAYLTWCLAGFREAIQGCAA